MKKVVLITGLCFLLMNSKAQDYFAQLDYPYTMHRMPLSEGRRIAYADEGNGPVLLMIHGMGSYAKSWEKNITFLKQHFRCIAVDLLGYGKSSKGRYPARMTYHRDALFELLDSLAIKSCWVAGHSMGGQIALHMALEKPERVKGLVLFSPAGIETFTQKEKEFLGAATPETFSNVSDEQYRKNLELNFYTEHPEVEEMYQDRMLIKQDNQFMDYCYVVSEGVKGMLYQPVFDELQKITQPTLIFYGQQDQLIPNQYLHPDLSTADIAKKAQEAMVQAEVHLIPEAGHFVHFDQANKINEMTQEFIKRNTN